MEKVNAESKTVSLRPEVLSHETVTFDAHGGSKPSKPWHHKD